MNFHIHLVASLTPNVLSFVIKVNDVIYSDTVDGSVFFSPLVKQMKKRRMTI